jgi:hypothetical protein
MRYINPYSLLSIEPSSLFDTPKNIRAAKRRVLADIELDGEIEVDGVYIDKTEALRAIDDLDDEKKRRFHSIVFFDESFRLFLTGGDSCWVFHNTDNEYFNDIEFREFIAPFYQYQFDKTLEHAIKTGDVNLAENLLSVEFPVLPSNRDNAYLFAKNYFGGKLNELEEKFEDLRIDKDIETIFPPDVRIYEPQTPFYNPFRIPSRVQPASKFKESFIKESDIRILNELPEEFQILRDNLAGVLRSIAVEIVNEHHEPEISLLIFRLAERIDAGSHLFDLIDKDISVINSIIIKNNLGDLSDQLDQIKDKIKERHFSDADEIVQTIDLVFDPFELNKISKTDLNNAIILIAMQLSEIAWLISTSYRAPDAGILVVERALKIKLSDSKVSLALWQKLMAVRNEIDRSRDFISEPAISSGKRKTSNNNSKRENAESSRGAHYDRQSSATTTKRPIHTNLFESYEQSNRNNGNFISRFFAVFKDNEEPVSLSSIAVVCIVFFIVGSAIITALTGDENFQATNIDNTATNLKTFFGQEPIKENLTVKETPTPQISRPKNGAVLTKGAKASGWGRLSIINDLDKDAIAKLVDTVSGKTYREVYIRSRSKHLITGIRPGDYYLLFSTGRDFAPSIGKFQTGPEYSKFDSTLNFAESRNQYGVGFRQYEVTLNPVAYGTATTSKISEGEFINR